MTATATSPELERARLSRINTNLTFDVYDDPWDKNYPLSPTNAYDATLGTSPGPHGITRPLDTIPVGLATKAQAPAARNETRKLLSHVLSQLANREKPPSIVDSICNSGPDSPERSIGALAESLKQAVRRRGRTNTSKSDKPTLGNAENDSDDEKDVAFSTDNTIELMAQLTSVLAMSIDRRWQIFDDRFVHGPGQYTQPRSHTGIVI